MRLVEPAVFEFWERVHAICEQDPRYRREAYEFVLRGLEHTMSRIVGEHRHVSGQELLQGLVDLARQEFGDMAWIVCQEWGIRTSEDFGSIVFHLVEAGLLGKQPGDTIDDFAGGVDLKAELEPKAHPR